ncbi:MAG: DUF2779 domain-containing protein [Bacteroidales bacterium]|nr:DUF2779 domain-containing protein [Bacteroidales bacterium]
MEKHILSKSTFIKGHQCLKALYLHKKRPFLRDKLSAEQIAKFKRGHKVGDMAQKLFPGGIDVSPKSPSQYQKSVLQTQELIAAGQNIIYEATFQFNKVLVMLDILVKTDKGWEAYEVKSSLKLSETYFTDAALQYYVITNSGLDLASFSLVYVNENYELQEAENIDLEQYFIKQEVSTEIKQKQTEISAQIEKELMVLTDAHSPKIEVGAHCFSPYPCDFFGFCWKTKATDLFKLPALSESERTNLLNRSVLSTEDLIKEKLNNPLADKQLNALLFEEAFLSDRLKLQLTALAEDSVYLGFVARQAAIPQCLGQHPYQYQLFAYALLSEEKQDANLFSGICSEYKTYLEDLIRQLHLASQIIVYDKAALEKILDQASDQYPEFKTEAETLKTKIAGIKQWVLEGEYYFPGLKHDLVFKDFARLILKKNPFAKQTLSSDVLAIKLFEESLENGYEMDKKQEDSQALLDYINTSVQSIKALLKKISE